MWSFSLFGSIFASRSAIVGLGVDAGAAAAVEVGDAGGLEEGSCGRGQRRSDGDAG